MAKIAISKWLDHLRLVISTVKLFLSSPEKVIVVNPLAGLGNRLEVIHSSILLGKQLDRKVYVCWERKGNIKASFNDLFLTPPEFQIAKITPYDVQFKLESLIPARLAKVLLWSVSYYLAKRGWAQLEKSSDNLFFFKNRIQKSPQVNVHAQNNLKPKFSDHINFEQMKSMRNVVFMTWSNFLGNREARNRFFGREVNRQNYDWMKPTPELRKRINKMASSFNDVTIGVHVRMGPDQPSKSWEKLEAEQIKERSQNRYTLETFIGLMRAEISKNSAANFFVASDSGNAIDQLKSVFGQRIIYQQNIKRTRDRVQGIKGAVVDLFLLSKTNLIIGSNSSSFSVLAAKIGQSCLTAANDAYYAKHKKYQTVSYHKTLND